jgi:hypothetical protein
MVAIAVTRAEAEACDVAEFRELAAGMARDRAAVATALRHAWSNGLLVAAIVAPTPSALAWPLMLISIALVVPAIVRGRRRD